MDSELVRRVGYLEETVESLRDLPDRTTRLELRMGAVELQIVQLRTEMRDEFSAIRREMVTKDDLKFELAALREEMATKASKADLESLREEMATKASKADVDAMRLELREDIAGLGREVAALILESDARTRVLIEDVIARIATGREGARGD
jgi:hypothetical protein